MRLVLYKGPGFDGKEEYAINDWKEQHGTIHAIQNMAGEKHHLFFDVSNYAKVRIKD